MSVNVGSRDKSKRGRAAVSHEPAMGDRIGKCRSEGKVFWWDRRGQRKKKNLPRERRWQAEQGTSNRPRRGAQMGGGRGWTGRRGFEVEVKKDEKLGDEVVRKMGDAAVSFGDGRSLSLEDERPSERH